MKTAISSGSRSLRLALLGCGHIGQDVYLPLLAQRPDMRIGVIAEASVAARSRAAATTGHSVPIVEDWREALARDDIDGAIIALPSSLHDEAARAALARGLHVYIEKPLATTIDDGEKVIAAHRRATAFGAMGFNYRFNPLYAELRGRVAAGAVGRVKAIRTVFSSPRVEPGGWRESRATGGGVLLELGSHHADLIRWVTSAEAVSVHCLLTDRDTSGARASTTIAFDNGVVAQMLVAFGTIADDRIEVIGERGAISVNRYRSLRPEARGVDIPGRLEAFKSFCRTVPRLPYLATKMSSPWHEPSHRLAIDRFAGAMRGNDTGGPLLEDGLASLRIVVAAEESSVSGRTIALK